MMTSLYQDFDQKLRNRSLYYWLVFESPLLEAWKNSETQIA